MVNGLHLYSAFLTKWPLKSLYNIASHSPIHAHIRTTTEELAMQGDSQLRREPSLGVACLETWGSHSQPSGYQPTLSTSWDTCAHHDATHWFPHNDVEGVGWPSMDSIAAKKDGLRTAALFGTLRAELDRPVRRRTPLLFNNTPDAHWQKKMDIHTLYKYVLKITSRKGEAKHGSPPITLKHESTHAASRPKNHQTSGIPWWC